MAVNTRGIHPTLLAFATVSSIPCLAILRLVGLSARRRLARHDRRPFQRKMRADQIAVSADAGRSVRPRAFHLAVILFGLLAAARDILAQNFPATLPDLKLSQSGYAGAIAVQGDGKIIIAGSFKAVNDVPRLNLARLNPNGSVDSTWNPPGPDGQVLCVLIDGNYLYIGGRFLMVGSNSCPSLARLRLDDTGTLDLGYVPAQDNYSAEVRSLAISGGQLYVGGIFTNMGGANLTNLARISPQGSGVADRNWHPNPDDAVSILQPFGPDLFAGGSFTEIGGLHRVYVARLSTTNSGNAAVNWDAGLSASGVPVTAFALGNTNLFVGAGSDAGGAVAKLDLATGTANTEWNVPVSGPVFALSVVADSLLVGGVFSDVGGDDTAAYLARVATSGVGVIDPNWKASFTGGKVVIGCLVVSGNWLYVGGEFNVVNGKARLGLAKLDKILGIADEQLVAQVENPGEALAFARQGDGKVIVGGTFSFADGLPRQNLARINTDGTLDSTWLPDADAPVYALVLSGGSVFAGGEFTRIGGLNRNGLARVFVAGSDRADPSWDAQTEPSTLVLALAASDTNLFVGGSFSSMGGAPRSNLARLPVTAGGAIDPLWQADADNEVRALAASGSNVFVGGDFLNINGIGRTNVAKLSAFGDGAVDANWNPGFLRADNPPGNDVRIQALLVDGTNLFVGGAFTNMAGRTRGGLAKVSTLGRGEVDAAWNPSTDLSGNAEIKALSVDGTNLYVGGQFFQLGGQPFQALARIPIDGAGDADPDFNPFQPNPSADVHALLLSGGDLYAGGMFMSIGGNDAVPAATRYGFALLARASAPSLAYNGTDRLFITRNLNDGPAVTHFQIVSLNGVSLFLNDGVTPVRTNDFITVEQGAEGLEYTGAAGSVTVVSAVNNTPEGTGTDSSTLVFGVPPAVTFHLASSVYALKEGATLTVPVVKEGVGAGSIHFATMDGNGIGGRDYQIRNGTLSFGLSETQKNLPVIATGNDFEFTGDRSFYVVLSDPAAGAGLASPARAIVTIIDDDGAGNADSFTTTAASFPLANAGGVLTVGLSPTNAYGQWRLRGALDWQESGAAVSGLVNGNYFIEFRPSNGYRQPEVVTVPINGAITNAFTFFYAATTNNAMGNLSVMIQPPEVASAIDVANRGQWRRQGETAWRDSGEIIANLNAGNYIVEFKPVPGRLTVPPQLIAVGADATYAGLGTYLFADASGAEVPAVVPFEAAITNAPYRYNGQLQSSVGFASGCVVKQRVVLTVAHALFDDLQLSYATEVNWFFQRYRDRLEPVPQVPRGWYVFEGYASQRRLDDSPGISTPASQNLDAAALYFLEAAGRDGFGGYLSSDQTDNEFLLGTANKFLAGYPLDGVADTDQGKLHATTPSDLTFFKAHDQVYATHDIQSFPGNSGGPLYVQNDQGAYYPAAICLGGAGELLVRAINSEVVDLINRAEISGNGGNNIVGGGVITLSPGITAPPFGTGLLTVKLSPSNSPSARPGWRIATDQNGSYITNSSITVALIGGGGYPIEFKSIPGFITPSNRIIQMAVGGIVTMEGKYLPAQARLMMDAMAGVTFSGVSGTSYRVEFATNLTPPVFWTPLTTFTLSGSSQLLTNTRPANFGQRIYRSVTPP